MKSFLLTLIGCLLGLIPVSRAQRVAVRSANQSPQAVYAAEQLKKALRERKYTVGSEPVDYFVLLKLDSAKFTPEA